MELCTYLWLGQSCLGGVYVWGRDRHSTSGVRVLKQSSTIPAISAFRYLQGLHSWIKLLGGAGGLSGYMYECVWIFELFDMLFFVLLVLVLLLVLAQRWLFICMFGCVVLLLVFVLLFFFLGLACRCM